MGTKKKIPPSQRIRKEINEIMEGTVKGKHIDKDLLKELLQKGKFLIAEEALEKEVEEFLQRPYY